MIRDGRITSIPKWVKEEWEQAAVTRIELCNELFLSHSFEICFCARCAAMCVCSAVLSKRGVSPLRELVLRRVCCECGYNLATATKPAR